MKNILYIYSDAHTHTGSPKALLDLIANLDKRFFKIHLCLPREGPLACEFRKYGGNVIIKHSLSLQRNNLLAYARDVIFFFRTYRRLRINLVHYNGTGWRDSTVLAAWLSRIPVILHLHNKVDIIKGNYNFLLAKKIIAVSKFMMLQFDAFSRISRKIVCIYNGVDLKRFYPKKRFLEGGGNKEKVAKVVGFVGQISHRKGVDLLIKCAPEIIKRFPDTVILIVGNPPKKENNYFLKLKKEVCELKLDEKVVFCGVQDDIPAIMNSLDLLVVPSRAEPFGKVIIEAMACKKCVIASNVGGIPEIITDGQNGLLFQVDNPSSLEKKILTVLRDDILRSRLASEGYNTVIRKFSIEMNVKKTQKLYESLISAVT